MIVRMSMSQFENTRHWPGISCLPTLQPESLLSTVVHWRQERGHKTQPSSLANTLPTVVLVWITIILTDHRPTLYTEWRNCSKLRSSESEGRWGYRYRIERRKKATSQQISTCHKDISLSFSVTFCPCNPIFEKYHDDFCTG